MSRSSYLFTGIFGTFAVSCFALVLVPQMQIGGLGEHVDEENGTRYPVINTRPGREIYVREGCYYCHTQQIRDVQNSTDIERGWGSRRTVGRDYIFENPPLLGSVRIGPDLANVGSKEWRNEPAGDPQRPLKRDRAWQLLHLYNPRAVTPSSVMPPFRYLFEEVKPGGERALDALPVKAKKDGYVVVPKAEAIQLVDYLLSLDRTAALPEAALAKVAAGKQTTPATAAAPAAATPAVPAAPAAAAAPEKK
jgi:cytochrome c oxidase cbb3-type subunit II